MCVLAVPLLQVEEPLQASATTLQLNSTQPNLFSPVSPCSRVMSPELFTPPSGSEDTISLSSTSAPSKKFTIPDSWPPSILQCIEQENDEERKRLLVPSVRNEIVRVLATNMFCQDPNPCKEFCTRVAKMLVKKYYVYEGRRRSCFWVCKSKVSDCVFMPS